MTAATIDITIKQNGGYTAVVIDGLGVHLDGTGAGEHPTNYPPNAHKYSVTVFGAPGNSCDYNLSCNGNKIDSGTLTIDPGDTFDTTYSVDFNLP